MSNRLDLVTRLAMGLTLRWLAQRPTLSDLRMLVHGRYHLLPTWEEDEEVRGVVARFLSHRPDDLADDRTLLEQCREVLSSASDFVASSGQEQEQPVWKTRYELVRGSPLDERIDLWFAQLEKLRGKTAGPVAPSLPKAGDVVLVGEGRSYRIPRAHVPAQVAVTPSLTTAAGVLRDPLELEALLGLAKAIDQGAPDTPGLYERVGVGHFLNRFVGADGARRPHLAAGVTKLAIAPTGTGKSVFARLLALHLARSGSPVALVVPDVQAVWKETLRLVQASSRAGLGLSIVPVSSWRNTAKHLSAYIEEPPVDDRGASWALQTVGYSCLLSAYVEGDDLPQPGQEPCARLKQRDSNGKEKKVVCPFAETCGRFTSFYRAVEADILVVNHHAFLAGRVPINVSVDGGAPRKLTTAELVLRRASVVLIDEVDALQNTAIGAESRGLILSSRGGLSKPYQLLIEVERRRAENRFDPRVRFERGRSALARIIHEAERLAELINAKALEWPARGRMTWRDANDAWLAGRLFGQAEEALDRVTLLYDSAVIEGDESAEALRKALLPLGPGLGDGTRMMDVQTAITRVLASWKLHGRRSGSVEEDRERLVNRLILRAVLVQLDKALEHLRPQLPGLEQQEVQQAADLRDDLLGYAPWQPSPVGPLGRRLHGYAFAERLGEQGALETRIMSGDPHGLIRELGGVVAQALAGRPRVVLGLSATCRFRGSPRADVLGEVAGWVRDEARSVTVHEASVQARISGIGSRAERMDAARAAAEELWTAILSHYLRGRLADELARGRARALLVTNSYAEATAAAQGLRRVAGQGLTIRYLVSDDADTGTDPDALSRGRLETFGKLPGPAVLVGPLSVVARGHNILQPGTQLSALSAVFVLTRPVPPSHDADRFLAHIAYNARIAPPAWRGSPGATAEAERADSWRRLRALQRSPATFRHMDPELRRELVCDVLVDLAQVAGRARRGGTPVDLYFVDGAFQDEVVPWDKLVADVLDWWRSKGWLPEMVELHGAFVAGLARYAGFDLNLQDREED